MKRLKRVLESVLTIVLSTVVDIVTIVLPTNNKLVLLGAMGGRYYGDNSRYVFECLVAAKNDIDVYWITRNNKVFKALKEKGYPVVRAFSLKGIWLVLRAHIALYTNGLADLSFHGSMVPRRLKLIALRHGRSVKRVRFASKNTKFDFVSGFLLKRETKMIKYAISTSEFISKVQSEVLNLELKQQVITGYPRNDLMLTPDKEIHDRWAAFIGGATHNLVILYGPTWRHGRKTTSFFPFENFDLPGLKSLLEANNILLLLRPHKNELRNPNVKMFLQEVCSASSNIRMATHIEYESVNDLLPFCDALICDYSALYHDFLLLDRPIIFVPYDYLEFEKQNGFFYDYFAYLPGPAVLTDKQFKDELKRLLKETDDYKLKRKELTKLIHNYQDNQSTERVVSLLMSMLEEDGGVNNA